MSTLFVLHQYSCFVLFYPLWFCLLFRRPAINSWRYISQIYTLILMHGLGFTLCFFIFLLYLLLFLLNNFLNFATYIICQLLTILRLNFNLFLFYLNFLVTKFFLIFLTLIRLFDCLSLFFSFLLLLNSFPRIIYYPLKLFFFLWFFLAL